MVDPIYIVASKIAVFIKDFVGKKIIYMWSRTFWNENGEKS